MSIKWHSLMVPGAGSQIGVLGNFQVADLATATVPVAIPGTGVFTQLTNDGEGAQTSNANAPNGVTELWDVVNDEFDFSQLKIGDQITIRVDMIVDVLTVNTDIELELAFFTAGPILEFKLNWYSAAYKTTGLKPISATSIVTVDAAFLLTTVAQFRMKADKACNVEVIGWDYLVNLRS